MASNINIVLVVPFKDRQYLYSRRLKTKEDSRTIQVVQMNPSTAIVPCSNAPSTFSYPLVPQPYLLTDSLIVDHYGVSIPDSFLVSPAKSNWKNTFYPFPNGLEAPPTNSSMTHTSGARHRRHSTVPPYTNSRLNGSLPFDVVADQRSQVAVKGEWKGRPTTEEQTRRRREQNRIS